LKTALTDLHWYTFEMWLRVHKRHFLVARQPHPMVLTLRRP